MIETETPINKFDSRASPEVVRVLAQARRNRTRVRIYYGNTVTGQPWNEEHDVTGYVGRSTGRIKIPLMVHNTRSLGGTAILDSCIVRIATARGKRTLYQHPSYKAPQVEIVTPSDIAGYAANVLINGEIHGRCRTMNKARWLQQHMS